MLPHLEALFVGGCTPLPPAHMDQMSGMLPRHRARPAFGPVLRPGSSGICASRLPGVPKVLVIPDFDGSDGHWAEGLVVLMEVAIPSMKLILMLITIVGMLQEETGLPKSRSSDRDRQPPMPLAGMSPDLATIALDPFGSIILIPVFQKCIDRKWGERKDYVRTRFNFFQSIRRV